MAVELHHIRDKSIRNDFSSQPSGCRFMTENDPAMSVCVLSHMSIYDLAIRFQIHPGRIMYLGGFVILVTHLNDEVRSWHESKGRVERRNPERWDVEGHGDHKGYRRDGLIDHTGV